MRLFFYLLITVLLLSCNGGGNEVRKSRSSEIKNGDTLTNDFARAFRVIEFNEYIQIDVIEPGNQVVVDRFGFGVNVPEDLINLGSKIESIAALSSTHVGMLRKLGLEKKIKGVSQTDYVCDSSLTKDWVSFGDLGQSDPELFLQHKPGLIMYSGFKLDHPILKKIDQIDIPTMVNYDWKETHPLGRVEWLKVFGVLFNLKDRAEATYKEIKEDYLELVKRIQNDESSPTVLVGTLYGDVFNVPAGDSYMAKMLEDANVKYRYESSEGTGSLNISLEEVITDNLKTDYLINIAAATFKDVRNMNQNFEMLKSFQEREVYSYYTNVNCFWEESAIAPEKVLSDLIHIFHPDQFEHKTFYFYSKLN